MNIILTCDYSPWCSYTGGTQRSVHNLATHLVQLGVKTSVVYSKSPFEKVKISDPVNYDIHWASMPSFRTKRSAVLRNWSAIGMAQKVKELWTKNTIVHANGEEAALAGFLRSELPFGFIATPRYPAYPEIPTVDFQKPPNLLQLTYYGKYRMMPYVVNNADRVVVASHFASEMIQHSFGVDESKIGVIPNGITDAAFDAPERRVIADTILFYGRLEKPKGIDLLLESFLKLPSTAKLTMVGNGTFEPEIKQFINQHELESRVVLKKWMSPEDLVTEISRSAIVCLPSIEESFGNAMAEAMAVSAPLISSNCCSIPELVAHEKSGLLAEPGSVDSLTHCLHSFLADPIKAEQMAAAAKIKSNAYRWSNVAKAWIEEYEALC